MLRLTGIEKSFGPVIVLRGVDLEVSAGEVHAVLGENGAGKSTLMRILTGNERADRGAMQLGGAAYAPSDPGAARARGVVMVPQERTLCGQLTVAENVLLGIEPVGRFGLLRRAAALERARAAIDLVAGPARLPLDALVSRLGVADQQLVEIARALAAGAAAGVAKVLVLDEPTASLGHDDAARLFARVRALKEGGLAIVLVTHFLGDVRAHADRYTVLRDGQVSGDGDARIANPATIVREMLGRELTAARTDEAPSTSKGEPHALLELRSVAGTRQPTDASLVLRSGEILGIAGLVGAGRTELLRAIVGLDRVVRGEVRVHATRGIGLLSEDRGGEGLMLGRSVAENIALSRRGPRLIRPRAVLEDGRRWIERLAIRTSGPDQRVSELSGGNQQKVQIARLLREDYDVLLVDEPTRGIDVASKAQVLALLRELARNGKGIVLVSSQLDELVATCDRICVLKHGQLGPATPATHWDEARLLLEAAS